MNMMTGDVEYIVCNITKEEAKNKTHYSEKNKQSECKYTK